MKRADKDGCRFVDLEARVGDSDEDEEDEEDEEDQGTSARSQVYWIVTYYGSQLAFFEVELTDESKVQYTHWRDINENSNQLGWSHLVSSLEERFSSGSGATNRDIHRNNPLASNPAIVASIDNISRLPTANDYPLWRVRCKVISFFLVKYIFYLRYVQSGSMEEEIVFFLLQMVHPRHEVRSAFAVPSVKGWVYLEATMNDQLQRLLRLTPGVLHNRCGICVQRISSDEGLALLKMRPLEDPPESGKWVQVRRGLYKDDFSYVLSALTALMEVCLLLISWLAPLDTSPSKRKRTWTRPTPILFDQETVKQYYTSEAHCIDEDIYSVGNDTFEHGLIVRSYNFNSVATGVFTIPLEFFGLFRLSGHPKIIPPEHALPKPSEWHFIEGEEVYIVDPYEDPQPQYKSGFISKLRYDAAELDTNEGIVIVPWAAICKVMRIGDFVEVTSGLHKDQKGWVDAVNLYAGMANIIQLVDQAKSFSDRVEVRPELNQ